MSKTIAKGGLALVAGAGLSGMAMLRALQTMGRPTAVWDPKAKRPEPIYSKMQDKNLARVPVYCGDTPPQCIDSATDIYVSPGLDPDDFAGYEDILGNELSLAARLRQATDIFVLITGTNGKTTTATWLAACLNQMGYPAAACGNIGYPLLDAMLDAQKSTEKNQSHYFVVEASSYQLQLGCSLEADLAVILNITSDHLQRHKNLENYRAAKHKIYDRAQMVVYNRDDPLTTPMRDSTLSFGMSLPNRNEVGLRTGKNNSAVLLSDHLEAGQLPATTLQNPGVAQNVLAVVAAARALGIEPADTLQNLHQVIARQQTRLRHRGQIVWRGKHCTWLDNSKATNPQAAVQQLQVFADSDNLGVLVGGDSKGVALDDLADQLCKTAVCVAAYGKSAKSFANLVKGVIPVHQCRSFDQAVRKVFAQVRSLSRSFVVLAPGCASTDQFSDYAARGERFGQLAKRLDPVAQP